MGPHTRGWRKNSSWETKTGLVYHYTVANKHIEVQKYIVEEMVMKDQWVKLISYWKSEDAQKLRRRNKEIRYVTISKLIFMKKDEQGHNPSRVVMLKKWCTYKLGNPKSDEVANTIWR